MLDGLDAASDAGESRSQSDRPRPSIHAPEAAAREGADAVAVLGGGLDLPLQGQVRRLLCRHACHSCVAIADGGGSISIDAIPWCSDRGRAASAPSSY